MIGIYKITSPSGKIYIGKSINIQKRFIKYKNLLCKEQTYLYNSLKKYGYDAHKIEILLECKKEDLDSLEIYYIKLFNTFNSQLGLNLRSGGEGGKMSEETKQKLSLRCKGNTYALGKKHSEEIKKRNGETRRGKTRNEETKKKISEALKGKLFSKQHKLNLSIALKNRKMSEETRLKMSEGQKRRQEKLRNNTKT